MSQSTDSSFELREFKNPLIRKFGGLLDLSKKETAYLEDLQKSCKTFTPGAVLFENEDELRYSYIVRQGWGYLYKLLPDGRRQILNISLPGDFIALYSSVARVADHSAVALTEMVVCELDSEEILEMFSRFPRLAAAVCWSAACVDSILEEQVVRVGRRSGYERTAHLLVELYRRCKLVGMVHTETFRVPFSQEILADTLALTPVWVNRTLRRLRQDGLISVERRGISIQNLTGLTQAAGFDSTYLNFDGLPRQLVSRLNRE